MPEQTERVAKVHLREEVAEGARFMELRMRLKDPLIRSGDWQHWKQMQLTDLIKGLRRNVAELERMAAEGADPIKVRCQAADVQNFANFLGLRIARGDRLS